MRGLNNNSIRSNCSMRGGLNLREEHLGVVEDFKRATKTVRQELEGAIDDGEKKELGSSVGTGPGGINCIPRLKWEPRVSKSSDSGAGKPPTTTAAVTKNTGVTSRIRLLSEESSSSELGPGSGTDVEDAALTPQV